MTAPEILAALRAQADAKNVAGMARYAIGTAGTLGVTMPVIRRLARQAGGNAINLKVPHSLGLGLDEKAMECVAKWRFKPGMKDGQPVTVQAQIEVNFRL